ncbi:MAG: MCE family protein [Pseudomonadales bacterium]|nr:MCE family protein [Pseudomonadales bacterium]
METRANYVLIGAVTLAGAVVAVLFALWAGRYTASANWADYEIRFSQAVTGLSTGGAVQYNGITVGTVRELSLAPEDARQVIARIRIQADAPVREDTVARLQLSGLTGITFIQLSGGSPDSPPRRAAPGEEIPRIPAEESALDRLIGASEGIANSANEVLLRVIELLSEENTARISATLANLNDFTATLSAERGQLETALQSVAGASASAERTLAATERTVTELNRTLGAVNEELIVRLPDIGRDLAGSLERLASMTGRADRLLAENSDAFAALGPSGLGQLGPTLLELQRLLQDLSRLTRRIDRDPVQYLLGGSQPEEYQPQ